MERYNSFSIPRRWITLLIVLAAILTISAQAAAAGELRPFVKLDPRLLGSTYGGPRWVSPVRYDVISGGRTYTIETMARLRRADGPSTEVRANWVSADPNLVTVDYTSDTTVALHINGQGETTVEAAVDGASTTLYITASYYSKACTNLRVVVSQSSQPNLPAQTCSFSYRGVLPLIIR